MKRCRHFKVIVYEHVSADIGYELCGGILIHDWAGQGNVTGRVTVKCKECSYHRTATSVKRLPKWAQKACEQAQAGMR